MIPRPYIKNHPVKFFNNTVNLRIKFNDTLNDCAAGRKNSHIIEFPRDHFNDFKDFDHLGRLSYEGKLHYWRFINNQIRKYDNGDLDLLPIKPKRSAQR